MMSDTRPVRMMSGNGEQRLLRVARRARMRSPSFGSKTSIRPSSRRSVMLTQSSCTGSAGSSRAEQDRGQQDQRLARVGRQRPDDELGEVVEDAAAFLHGGLDGGEVVVGEDHGGRAFRHVGAGDAHGHADVGLLERGRVVHAVAGHGDDVAARLQRLHEAELLLGRDAGEDGGALGDFGQIRVGDLFQLAAGEGDELARVPRGPSGRSARRWRGR